MNKKNIIIIIAITFISLLGFQTTRAAEGKLTLQIKRGFLTIAGSGSIEIGSITNNTGVEERIIPLSNNFQIKDTSGLCSGHYTTLQISSLTNGTSFIPNNNIQIQINALTTILGKINNNLSIGTNIYNILGNTNTPVTYINRPANMECGTIGIYGATGDIKINIPANQETGTYRGKIYYLLIDKN